MRIGCQSAMREVRKPSGFPQHCTEVLEIAGSLEELENRWCLCHAVPEEARGHKGWLDSQRQKERS